MKPASVWGAPQITRPPCPPVRLLPHRRHWSDQVKKGSSEPSLPCWPKVIRALLLTGDWPRVLQEAAETPRAPPSSPAHSVAPRRVGRGGGQAGFGQLARRNGQAGEAGAGASVAWVRDRCSSCSWVTSDRWDHNEEGALFEGECQNWGEGRGPWVPRDVKPRPGEETNR